MKLAVRVTWIAGLVMFGVSALCFVRALFMPPDPCIQLEKQNPYACGFGPVVSNWFIYAILAIVLGVLLLGLAGLMAIIVSIWRHYAAKSQFASVD